MLDQSIWKYLCIFDWFSPPYNTFSLPIKFQSVCHWYCCRMVIIWQREPGAICFFGWGRGVFILDSIKWVYNAGWFTNINKSSMVIHLNLARKIPLKLQWQAPTHCFTPSTSFANLTVIHSYNCIVNNHIVRFKSRISFSIMAYVLRYFFISAFHQSVVFRLWWLMSLHGIWVLFCYCGWAFDFI